MKFQSPIFGGNAMQVKKTVPDTFSSPKKTVPDTFSSPGVKNKRLKSGWDGDYLAKVVFAQ